MKKIFCLGFLLLLLTGCSLEEKLVINPELSGEVNISFESLIENDEKIKEYLGDKEYKTDCSEEKCVYVVSNSFENVTELGFNESEFNIRNVNGTVFYNIRLNEEDGLLNLSEYKEFLEENDIDIKFIIRLNGHFLTNVEGYEGNYDAVKTRALFSYTEFTWIMNGNKSIVLNANLPTMHIEYVLIFIGVVIGLCAGAVILIKKSKLFDKNVDE